MRIFIVHAYGATEGELLQFETAAREFIDPDSDEILFSGAMAKAHQVGNDFASSIPPIVNMIDCLAVPVAASDIGHPLVGWWTRHLIRAAGERDLPCYALLLSGGEPGEEPRLVTLRGCRALGEGARAKGELVGEGLVAWSAGPDTGPLIRGGDDWEGAASAAEAAVSLAREKGIFPDLCLTLSDIAKSARRNGSITFPQVELVLQMSKRIRKAVRLQ